MSFSNRSYQKELLDREDIPFADIRQNMQELDVINTYLGGHAITVSGIRTMLAGLKLPAGKSWLICEIGCGGGDNLLAIRRWLHRKNISARFVGIDINPDCIAVATEKCSRLNCTFITSDYKLAGLKEQPDVIFSSLLCHHFSDEQLVVMLQWMKVHSRHGFFINDLHRHPLAYYSIKMLTAVFSSSYLVRNDAPLSVKRGFTRKEWNRLMQEAGIAVYAIRWKWAFRYLITAAV